MDSTSARQSSRAALPCQSDADKKWGNEALQVGEEGLGGLDQGKMPQSRHS